MTLNSFIKSMAEREDNLFGQIYGFNELISGYVDESHLLAFPDLANYWAKLGPVGRVQKKLSKLLLKYFKLENKPFYGFEDPRLRIVLLDENLLNDLLVYAGAVISSERISKIILKQDVLKLKESIGEDMYFFATKKASLLIGFAPKVHLLESVITRQTLFEGGKECLELCLANEAENLLKRFVLKFPRDIKWDFNSPVIEEQKTKAWNFLYKILVREVDSEVKRCFT